MSYSKKYYTEQLTLVVKNIKIVHDMKLHEFKDIRKNIILM